MPVRLAQLRTVTLVSAASVLLTGTPLVAAQEAPAKTPATAPASPPASAPAAAPASAPAAAPASAPAAAPAVGGAVYNIEIIVFRATSALGGPEDWSAEAGSRAIAGDESASGASQVGHFVATLPSSVWQLSELENRLRSSGTYVPVAHAAWSQTASSWGTRAGFSMQKLGIDVPGLSGTVFLERGQFLHLGMTLSYAMPSPPQGLGAAPDTPFTLNESRRVRFYERDYFDNPAFGVIALVTPAQSTRPPGR
jgi:Peptidoglycan-binding protein, CsiV